MHVDRDALITLTQESLEKATSIQRLEEAATELYKALLAGQDTGQLLQLSRRINFTEFGLDMAATMERLYEYRTHNTQFCKRMFDFLSIMFTAQVSCPFALQPRCAQVLIDNTGHNVAGWWPWCQAIWKREADHRSTYGHGIIFGPIFWTNALLEGDG